MDLNYRNTVEIISLDQGITIEVGFLWKREGQLMILVDDDQYVTAPYDITKFNLEKLK